MTGLYVSRFILVQYLKLQLLSSKLKEDKLTLLRFIKKILMS
jgi:hypothetical protein